MLHYHVHHMNIRPHNPPHATQVLPAHYRCLGCNTTETDQDTTSETDYSPLTPTPNIWDWPFTTDIYSKQTKKNVLWSDCSSTEFHGPKFAAVDHKTPTQKGTCSSNSTVYVIVRSYLWGTRWEICSLVGCWVWWKSFTTEATATPTLPSCKQHCHTHLSWSSWCQNSQQKLPSFSAKISQMVQAALSVSSAMVS